MRARALSLILILVLINELNGQIKFDKAYDFLVHLQNIEAYREGIFFINANLDEYSVRQKDTLNYLNGVFHYQLKEIDASISSFAKVQSSNPTFFARAKFLSAFQYAFQGDYESAKRIDTLSFNSPLYSEIKSTELAGISLLQRDFEAFDQYQYLFSGEYFQLAGVQDQLKRNKEGLLKVRNKSGFKAGLLSGVVPGMGKFYLNKVGEGYITLLISAILALQVREAYVTEGTSSVRFKVFSGLFGAVYIANIWGSVVAVKVYKDEINDTYDEAILLNMHIPLRTIFD